MTLNNQTDEICRKFGEFLGQAICGTQIALYRVQGLPIEDKSQIKAVAVIKYLNDCWASLVLGDDPYITETVGGICECLLDDSPLCIFHLFWTISEMLLNSDPMNHIGFSALPHERTNQNDAYVAVLRNALKIFYTAEATRIAKRFYENRGPHECHGVKYPEIHTQNPSPIWNIEFTPSNEEASEENEEDEEEVEEEGNK